MAEVIGPVFARHGYVFLYLFRRGVGLSSNEGDNSVDLMNREFAANGQDARNSLQMQLLETREMSDALAGLAFLRALPEVDARDVAITGDSFGGSLTLLVAEREPSLRAAVIFACAGYSWDRSAPLRARLLAAVGRASVPFFFIHAANDYSVAPGKALDAKLRQAGKQHRLKIYPPVGQAAEEGHGFMYLRVTSWERDVFAFFDQHMRKGVPIPARPRTPPRRDRPRDPRDIQLAAALRMIQIVSRNAAEFTDRARLPWHQADRELRRGDGGRGVSENGRAIRNSCGVAHAYPTPRAGCESNSQPADRRNRNVIRFTRGMR
jgi:dienelactone hydrolase